MMCVHDVAIHWNVTANDSADGVCQQLLTKHSPHQHQECPGTPTKERL